MGKREIKIDELLLELERNGRRHRWYFHYTTLDVLEKILTSGRLFLSRVDEMNDGREKETVPSNMFAACFSSGSTESVAMWNTYGIPRKYAVRLCFDGRLIRKFLDGKLGARKYYAVDKSGKVIDDIPLEKVKLSMSDIVYVSKDEKYFQYREDHCTVLGDKGVARKLLRGKLKGHVKMGGWSYEREVRLLLSVNRDYIVPGMKYIAIDFSGVIKCLKANKKIHKEYPILLGPWTVPGTKDKLSKRKMKVDMSVFSGYLDNLKTICDKCEERCAKKCKCEQNEAMNVPSITQAKEGKRL